MVYHLHFFIYLFSYLYKYVYVVICRYNFIFFGLGETNSDIHWTGQLMSYIRMWLIRVDLSLCVKTYKKDV